MTELTQERVSLLDKLYNLRGEDSIITTSIKKDIEQTTNTKTEKETTKKETQIIKANLEMKLRTFDSQADTFISNFEKFDNNSFEMLKEIEVNIEIQDLINKIKESKPEYDSKLKENIIENESLIKNLEYEISELEEKISKDNDALKEDESNKKILNDLLKNVLEQGNADSYNRAFIKNKLSRLNYFTEDEISILEFLILFPEKGLQEYENSIKDGSHKIELIKFVEDDGSENKTEVTETSMKVVEEEYVPISEPIIKTTEEPEEEDLEKTTLMEPVIVEEEQTIVEEENVQEPVLVEEPIKVQEEIQEPEIVEEQEETTTNEEPTIEVKEDSSELQEELGINVELNDEEKNMISLNKNIAKTNIEIFSNELDIDKNDKKLYEINNNYMYATDSELQGKINTLRSKGLNDKIIATEILNGNFKCDYDSLKKRIEKIEKNNGSIKENIQLLKLDMVTYYENIDKLNETGIPVDDKEKINYRYILANKNFDEDLSVLKEYLIMIRKANGKLALNIFNKDQKDLTISLDDLLEANLEELVENNPEVLSQDTDAVLKRIKYCEANNIEIKNEDSFMKYIYDPQSFSELIKNREEDIEDIKLDYSEKTNKILESLIDNKELVKSLDEYYKNENNMDVVLNDETNEIKCNKVLENLDTILNTVSNEDDRTIKIDNQPISVNKLIRNITIMANSGIDVEENEKEAILVSALYNLRSTEEIITNIIQKVKGIEIAEGEDA